MFQLRQQTAIAFFWAYLAHSKLVFEAQMFFTKLKNEPCNIHKYQQVGKCSLYTRVNFPVEIQLPAEGTHLFIHKIYGAEQYKDELGWPWSTWGIGLRGQRTGQRTGQMTGQSTAQDQGCQYQLIQLCKKHLSLETSFECAKYAQKKGYSGFLA